MSKSSPKILVLGKGNLGGTIDNALKEIGQFSLCILIRSIDEDCPLGDVHFDIIIDCMDLSHDLYPNYSALQDSIFRLRSKFLSILSPDRYYYVSTANLYVPSFEVIHEASQVYKLSDLRLTPYLINKIETECLLAECLKERLTILRPVSLWSHELMGTKDGFFADLQKSQRSNYSLPIRAGDENVISYMSYLDAAKVIISIVFAMKKHLKVCNISSWQWASRSSLKKGQLHDSDSTQRGRRITSLHYTKADLPDHLLELL